MFTPQLSQLLVECQQTYSLHKYQKIWVAYSGGVDSHVLLHLASQCFNNLHAMHINHGCSDADDVWQQHCATVCKKLNIPLHVCKMQLKVKPGQSIETAARSARRKAWTNFLTAEDVLLVAHHADDQAETVLYRLMRGTGPRGLCGIQMLSKVGNTTLLRPLLKTNKEAIITYAQQHKLNWLDDHSNQDNVMDRNFIRNKIIPLMRSRWPAANANINRAAELCTNMLQQIMPQVNAQLSMMWSADNSLDLQLLAKCSALLQVECLRTWLQSFGLSLSARQLQLLQQEVIAARADAMPQLRIGSKTINRSRQRLYILDAQQTMSAECTMAWDLQQSLQLPDGQQLHANQVFIKPEYIAKLQQQNITVRMGVFGRKAKKIFQQHAIPHWERDKYPLVFANNRLVSVVGLWCSPRILPQDGVGDAN